MEYYFDLIPEELNLIIMGIMDDSQDLDGLFNLILSMNDLNNIKYWKSMFGRDIVLKNIFLNFLKNNSGIDQLERMIKEWPDVLKKIDIGKFILLIAYDDSFENFKRILALMTNYIKESDLDIIFAEYAEISNPLNLDLLEYMLNYQAINGRIQSIIIIGGLSGELDSIHFQYLTNKYNINLDVGDILEILKIEKGLEVLSFIINRDRDEFIVNEKNFDMIIDQIFDLLLRNYIDKEKAKKLTDIMYKSKYK